MAYVIRNKVNGEYIGENLEMVTSPNKAVKFNFVSVADSYIYDMFAGVTTDENEEIEDFEVVPMFSKK